MSAIPANDDTRWLTGPSAPPETDPGRVPTVVTLTVPAVTPATALSVLVVGGCGGAGTTTTALGLAAAVAAASKHRSVAVDATHCGGDLGLRGADERLQPTPLQAWLTAAETNSVGSVQDCLSRATSGAGLLWRDAAPMQRRATFATAGTLLRTAGFVPIYDGGHPVSGRHLRPLFDDSSTRIVLTIPARVDAANRMRTSLQWLDDEYGGDTVAALTLVVSHQSPETQPVGPALRNLLGSWVRDVTEVPFDPHLATGLAITHSDLAEHTRESYAALLEGVWA